MPVFTSIRAIELLKDAKHLLPILQKRLYGTVKTSFQSFNLSRVMQRAMSWGYPFASKGYKKKRNIVFKVMAMGEGENLIWARSEEITKKLVEAVKKNWKIEVSIIYSFQATSGPQHPDRFRAGSHWQFHEGQDGHGPPYRPHPPLRTWNNR